jgi:hypothetical protein
MLSRANKNDGSGRNTLNPRTLAFMKDNRAGGEITPGLSANLTLPDYGRLARQPSATGLQFSCFRNSDFVFWIQASELHSLGLVMLPVAIRDSARWNRLTAFYRISICCITFIFSLVLKTSSCRLPASVG